MSELAIQERESIDGVIESLVPTCITLHRHSFYLTCVFELFSIFCGSDFDGKQQQV